MLVNVSSRTSEISEDDLHPMETAGDKGLESYEARAKELERSDSEQLKETLIDAMSDTPPFVAISSAGEDAPPATEVQEPLEPFVAICPAKIEPVLIEPFVAVSDNGQVPQTPTPEVLLEETREPFVAVCPAKQALPEVEPAMPEAETSTPLVQVEDLPNAEVGSSSSEAHDSEEDRISDTNEITELAERIDSFVDDFLNKREDAKHSEVSDLSEDEKTEIRRRLIANLETDLISQAKREDKMPMGVKSHKKDEIDEHFNK